MTPPSLIKGAWDWGAKFIAPIGFAFLAGLLTHAKWDADARAKAAEKADKETAAAITEVGKATVNAITAARAASEKQAKDYETLSSVIRKNRAPVGGCVADLAQSERLRVKTEAANDFVARALSGGIENRTRED